MIRPVTRMIRALLPLLLVVRLLPAPLAALLAPIDPLAGFTICHGEGADPSPDAPAGKAHDCALCPVCLWPQTPSLASDTPAPRPILVPASQRIGERPATRAPPPTVATPQQPRAPPV